MIHRVGLFIASLAATGALIVALSLAGFEPGGGATAGTSVSATGSATGQATAATGVQPDPQVQIDTVYLAAPEPPATVTVHKVVPAASSGEDGEHEHVGGDD